MDACRLVLSFQMALAIYQDIIYYQYEQLPTAIRLKTPNPNALTSYTST